MSNTGLTNTLPIAHRGARLRWLIVAALLVVFALILVRTAWMSDDAYITLRSVDNLIHGYGPTWNVAERVQSFTHPLWMLLLSAAYFITREAFFTTIVISIVLSLVVLFLVSTRLSRSYLTAAIAAAALFMSKAFVDYSTSGLENALTHLLLALFFVVFLRDGPVWRKLFWLAFLTALLAVNRIDAVLLVSIPFLLFLIENRSTFQRNLGRTLGVLLVGFLPLLAWEVFSVLYYGFPVPNTAFAKLNTDIPQSTLLQQGLTYLAQSTRVDFFTSFVIAAGSLAALSTRKPAIVAMVASAWLYVAYVVWIGGDFMSGRFLAAPFFCIVVAVAASDRVPQGRAGFALLAALLVIGIAAPRSPIRGDAFYECGQGYSKTTGIDDERGCYFSGTGLVKQQAGQTYTPAHGLLGSGLDTRGSLLRVQINGAVGMYGYAAGPSLHIVDLNALSDPLMARLPMPTDRAWRIGHFERLIPAGYVETLVSGENRLCNPGLHEFYDHLSTITRGPLFTPERLAAIWRMNTGQYGELLEGYGNPDALSSELCNAVQTNIEFVGGPRLVGYSIPTFQPGPGSTLPMTLYWQRGDEHETPLASFVHIRPSQEGQAANPRSESGMWAQAEYYEPVGRWTSVYEDGYVYVHPFMLDIPADMPAGVYHLEVGLFNTQTGEQFEPKPETVTPPYAVLWRSVLLPPITIQ